jgi:hypothetical protein
MVKLEPQWPLLCPCPCPLVLTLLPEPLRLLSCLRCTLRRHQHILLRDLVPKNEMILVAVRDAIMLVRTYVKAVPELSLLLSTTSRRLLRRDWRLRLKYY